MKVVIDTNVLIKGLVFYKKYFHCDTILNLIDESKVQIVFSQDSIGELIYVLKNILIMNLKMNEEESLNLLNKAVKLIYYAESVNTLDVDAPNCNDEFDDMFLECYVKSNADYIITDDFQSGMHDIEGIKALSSLDFIKKYYSSQAAIGKE